MEGEKSVNKIKIKCRWYVAKANCMVHCIPSRPRRKRNFFSWFMWTMSFPENSRRSFLAPPLAPLLGKANAGKVVSVHYWPQLKFEDQWTPVWINVTSCFRVLLLQRVQHRVPLLKENTAVPVPPRSNPCSSSHIGLIKPCSMCCCSIPVLRIQPNSPPF